MVTTGYTPEETFIATMILGCEEVVEAATNEAGPLAVALKEKKVQAMMAGVASVTDAYDNLPDSGARLGGQLTKAAVILTTALNRVSVRLNDAVDRTNRIDSTLGEGSDKIVSELYAALSDVAALGEELEVACWEARVILNAVVVQRGVGVPSDVEENEGAPEGATIH
jgi:hypothetical protein